MSIICLVVFAPAFVPSAVSMNHVLIFVMECAFSHKTGALPACKRLIGKTYLCECN